MRFVSLSIRLLRDTRAITSLEYSMIAVMVLVTLAGAATVFHPTRGCMANLDACTFNRVTISL